MIVTTNLNTPNDENVLIIDHDVLRDLFAAFALMGILANPQRVGGSFSEASDVAYEYAYTMLEAREK